MRTFNVFFSNFRSMFILIFIFSLILFVLLYFVTMPDHKRRFESMLFNYESSVRTDFRDGEITPIIKTKYQGRGTCLRVKPRPLKDIHALTDWRVPNVPFDLFGIPKDVVRTNPNDVQKAYGQPLDLERKDVQKTRPRLVITPAGSLDDMEDGSRNMLLDSIYLTSQVYTTRGALTSNLNVQAPFTGKPAPANPLSIPKLQPPFVSPEWRMDSVSWDNRQIRTHCLPTQEFWLARRLNCEECIRTATRDKQKKMKRRH